MYTGSFPFFFISREFDSINCSENFFVNAYTQRLSTIIHIFIESWDNICIFFLFKTIIWFDGPENNEETAVFDLVSVSWHHLCFNTTPGFLGLFNFFFVSMLLESSPTFWSSLSCVTVLVPIVVFLPWVLLRGSYIHIHTTYTQVDSRCCWTGCVRGKGKWDGFLLATASFKAFSWSCDWGVVKEN